MTEQGSGSWLETADLTTVPTAELARLVHRTSERELRHRLIGGVREVAVREIFRRMPEYLRPSRADGFDAVVVWLITGADPGGRGVDEVRLRIRDGRCEVCTDRTEPAQISVRTDAATLLRIVTGAEDPVLAVLKQHLSVRGDLALAARLTKLFTLGPATAPE